MNWKKILCGSILTLGISLSIPYVSQASTESDPISLSKENNNLTMNINLKGDYFKVYKDKELVYEGEDNKYQEKMNYDSQKYKVGVYSKGQLINVYSLKVTNESNNKLRTLSFNEDSKEDYVSKTIKNTRLETIVGTNSVRLEWPALPDADNTYEIYRDNEKIAETSDLFYVDNTVNADTKYRYTVKVQNVLTHQAKKEAIAKAKLKNKSLNLEGEIENQDITYDGTISTIIFTSKNEEKSFTQDKVIDPIIGGDGNGVKTMAIPRSNEFSFDYRTFIPYKSVANLNPFSGHNYLKGDNRSFAPYSDKYRTETSVYAMLSNPAAVTLYSDVSPTYSCTDASCSTTKLVGTASDSGITLNKYSVATNNLRWSVNHSVGAPLFAAPAVDYYYIAILSNKTFSASGDHDKAPNHEFWMNFPSGEEEIYTYAISKPSDFWNMIGIKTSWSFDM